MNKKLTYIIGSLALLSTLFACNKKGTSSISTPSKDSSSSSNDVASSTTSSSTSSTPIVTYDKVTFGTYPQSKVTDETLVSSLNTQAGSLPSNGSNQNWTSYKYYYGVEQTSSRDNLASNENDFMWYQDVTYNNNSYRGVYFTSYRPDTCTRLPEEVNTKQKDNGYLINTVYWFKFEDISWRVLSETSDDKFLWTDKILDAQTYYHDNHNNTTATRAPYDSETTAAVYDNNYKYSDIRGWLNEDFYSLAFTSDINTKIKTSTVTNTITGNTYACENTEDKVFILSNDELKDTSYKFTSDGTAIDNARETTSTDYAKCMGLYVDKSKDNQSYYLTRTPRSTSGAQIEIVGPYGEGGGKYNVTARYADMGIRPAMHISK